MMRILVTTGLFEIDMAVFIGAVRNPKWYWVIGNYPNYRVTTHRPRGKVVREPHESWESAQRWIAMEFLMNA
jgi:hypothetical protein